jgi:hypothetical protein
MNLAIHLPGSERDAFPSVWGLARLAPRFEVEGRIGTDVSWTATFPDCAGNVDLALHLIRESTRIPRAWVTVNGRRLSSVEALRDRLECYRASLNEPDRDLYCTGKRKEEEVRVGCQESSCPRLCQFLCVTCDMTVPESDRPPSHPQFEQTAALAEVDWCPNLKMRRSHS